MEFNVVQDAKYCVTAITDCIVYCGETEIGTVEAGKQKEVYPFTNTLRVEGECILLPVR